MSFANKIVFVTAAAGAGIGQGVARAFAEGGATVIMSDQHEGRTEKVAAELTAH